MAMRQLYELLCECRAKSIVDLVIETLDAETGEHVRAIATVARRLIREAPDVEPVKVGVALLGMFGTSEDSVLISTVGLYEEITAYSVLAFQLLFREKAETEIWRLAKGVYGWGRVNAVECLASTTLPEIKEWMLREGFRNDILDEYLAQICATSGDLKQALADSIVDSDLLAASADLLQALINGGLAEGVTEYADGPAVCLSFLRHMRTRPVRSLSAVACVLGIGSLVDGDRWATLQDRPGWTAEVRLQARSLVNEVLQQMGARQVVEDGLRSEVRADFFVAANLASHFGIDAWPLWLERQRRGSGEEWYFLMQTERRDRIEQVLELVRTRLELEDDAAPVVVIQGLSRFPGLGWDVLQAGLRNGSGSVRDATIRVLGAWEREAWPSDAMEELRAAAAREPDDDIRKRIEDLMSGRSRDSGTL